MNKLAVVGKKSKGEKAFDILNYSFMVIFVIAILYPVLNVISISLSDDYYVLTSQVSFFPRGLDLDAYKEVFGNSTLLRAYGNTIVIAAVGCVLSLVFTSFAAYPLAFSNFKGKKAVSLFIVFTMWFNGGMIPNFIVMRELHLLNSLWSLVFASLIGAYNVIILRNFFESIPNSLIESAKMDGANDFRVLFQIVWPLSKAALALVALWVIVGHWNAFFEPLLYIMDTKKYTLQLVLRDIVLLASGQLYGYQNVEASTYSAISEQTKNAVVFISMAPMLILYPFLQKYFVGGIMLGAVKE